MSDRLLGKVLAVVMAVVFPASLVSAETHGAMLYISNSVILNGSTVARNTALFPGDTLSVPGKSSATMTLEGSSVVVPAGSSVTFEGDSVSLQPQSAVSVATKKGMAARIETVRVRPANGSAKFQVARFNGRIFVAAKQGSLVVVGSSAEKAVADGATVSFSDPVPQKPGAVPATTGVGAGSIPTWVAVLIGVAAAGAGAAIGIATTGTPASPVKP